MEIKYSRFVFIGLLVCEYIFYNFCIWPWAVKIEIRVYLYSYCNAIIQEFLIYFDGIYLEMFFLEYFETILIEYNFG